MAYRRYRRKRRYAARRGFYRRRSLRRSVSMKRRRRFRGTKHRQYKRTYTLTIPLFPHTGTDDYGSSYMGIHHTGSYVGSSLDEGTTYTGFMPPVSTGEQIDEFKAMVQKFGKYKATGVTMKYKPLRAVGDVYCYNGNNISLLLDPPENTDYIPRVGSLSQAKELIAGKLDICRKYNAALPFRKYFRFRNDIGLSNERFDEQHFAIRPENEDPTNFIDAYTQNGQIVLFLNSDNRYFHSMPVERQISLADSQKREALAIITLTFHMRFKDPVKGRYRAIANGGLFDGVDNQGEIFQKIQSDRDVEVITEN